MATPAKQYYVQLPGFDQGEMWDEEKYNRNKEQLYQDHADAMVYETSPVADDDDSDVADLYNVYLPGHEESETWDSAKFQRNRAALMADHPDVQVTRMRPVGNYGDQIRQQNSHQAAMEQLHGVDSEPDNRTEAGWENVNRLRDTMLGLQSAVDNYGKKMEDEIKNIPSQQARVIRESQMMKEKGKLMDQLRQASKDYYTHPYVVEDNQRGESMAKKANEDLDALYESVKQEKGAQNIPVATGGTSVAMGGAPAFYGENEDQKMYNAAHRLNEETARIYGAPGKYGDEKGINNFMKGAADRVSQDDFWSMGLTGIQDQMQLKGVFDKIRDKIGGMSKITEENIDEALTPLEKQLLTAFFLNADAQAARAEDMSMGYRAGQSAADSIQFMAQFALSGGIASGALKAATGDAAVESMSKWIANAIKSGGKKFLGKAGASSVGGAAKLAGEGAARVIGDVAQAMVTAPLQPGMYKSILEAKNQLDENGEIVDPKAGWKGFFDYGIEVFSESTGDYLGNVLGAGAKLIGADKILKKAAKTKLGRWGNAFYNSAQLKGLRAGGWHNGFGEMEEEFIGAALRTITGLDPDAWKEQWKGENIGVMALSFLPMTMYGGVMSTARYGYAQKQYDTKRSDLFSRLENLGFSPEQIEYSLDSSRMASPEDIMKSIEPIASEMIKHGATRQDTDALADYALASAKLNIFDGFEGERVAQERQETLNTLQDAYGDFWQEAPDGTKTVQRVTLPDGRSGYVKKIDAETGEIMFIDEEGKPAYTHENVGAQVTTEGLDQYLDGVNLAKNQAADEQRMSEEAQEAQREFNQKLASNEAVPFGAKQDQRYGTLSMLVDDAGRMIPERDDQGNYLVLDEGGVKHPVTKDELASKWGIELNPKTQEQIDAEELAEYSSAIDRRDNYNKIQPGTKIQATLEGIDEPVEYEFIRAQYNEETGGIDIVVNDPADTTDNGEKFVPEEAFQGLEQMAAGIEQEKENEEPQPIDDTPRDFRGKPLPMVEGEVDEDALWNDSPEAWAVWNDSVRNDGGQNSVDYINLIKRTLEQQKSELQSAYNGETSKNTRKELERQMLEKDGEIAKMDDLLRGYEERAAAAKQAVENAASAAEEKPVESEAVAQEQAGNEPIQSDTNESVAEQAEEAQEPTPEQAEEQRRIPLRERAMEWAAKTGVDVTLMESVDDIENQQAIDAIAAGEQVKGWYDKSTGKVYLYLPMLEDETDVDKTYVHEVISHKGLDEMLGAFYPSLLDRVWDDVMDEKARKRFENYVKKTNPRASGDSLRRAAADEYIANLAENLDVEENQTAWEKFVKIVRNFLIKMVTGGVKLTDEDLSSLLQASMARYRDLAEKGRAEPLMRRKARAEMAKFSKEVNKPTGQKEAGVGSEARFSITQEDNLKKAAEAFNKKLAEKPMTEEELRTGNDAIDRMVAYMRPYLDLAKDGKRYMPEEVFGKEWSTIFKNGSYGRTMENTLLCMRTLAYNDFVNAVQEKIGRPLTVTESFLASQMLYDIATDPQCLYCYVALDRKAYNAFLKTYIEQRDVVLDKYKADDTIDKSYRLPKQSKSKKERTKLPDDNPVNKLYNEYLNGREDSPVQRRRFNSWLDDVSDGTLIKMSDLTSPEKRQKVALQGESYARQIEDAERYAQAASWAKKQEEYRAYNGELLKMPQSVVDMLNSEYGLRFYSFSEYTPAFIVENMQMVRDAALRNLVGLAYTKEVDFAKIFAPTGVNINISVYGREAEDGTVVMDTKQGADWTEASALREKYGNVGVVFVATNDKMVEWAINQPWIDCVIPFHIVRTGENVAAFYDWTNYTSMEGEKDSAKHTKYLLPTEHKNDKETFLALCEERGLKPRFADLILPSTGRSVVESPNYMKLVNETRRSVEETERIKPAFDLDAARESFDKFVEKGGYYGGWFLEEGAFERGVDQVAADVLAGKTAKEVDYGRQDIKMSADKLAEMAKKRTRPRTHQGTPLTAAEKQRGEKALGDILAAIGKNAEEKEEPKTMMRMVSNDELFDMAKERFGTTRDIREAGYILPDGTLLDFSGRHQVSGDSSYLSGSRHVDHRDIADLNYKRDLNTPSGIETDMVDFINRGAVRIDGDSGSINLAVKPTDAQMSVIRRIVERTRGEAYIDFGADNTDHYAEYDGARPERIVNDIKRYFDEGYKPEGNIMFRITPEQDKEYLDAVERGDMDKAQQMVRDAAQMAGYTIDAYHGTAIRGEDEPFTWFNTDNQMGAHFGTEEQANNRAKMREGFERGLKQHVYHAYLKLKKPIEINDVGNFSYKRLGPVLVNMGIISQEENDALKSDFQLKNLLMSKGYDGFEYENKAEGDGISYVAFDPNQIKSADPVTYDDNGNVIPLSERFNEENEDIRFRLAPNGKESNLTDEQYDLVRTPEFKKWFGDWENDSENASKVVDENGEPRMMYHGTNKEFNTFRASKRGIWFAGTEKRAAGYAAAKEGERVIPVFLNIRKPASSEYPNAEQDDWTRFDKLGYDGWISYNDDGSIFTAVVASPNQIKSATENNGDYSTENPDIRFRVVTDPLKVAELEAMPKVKVYRSMQEIDGKLYPPMSARVDGQLRQPTELGVWEESEERPELADEDGNFKLDKGNKKSLKAAYAPYFHTRRSPLNEQFSEAYNRPNLVVVEGEIPESELTSGYTAEKSKKSVGEHDWPSGKVSNALAKKGQDTRKVILSRWFKPVRVVPNSEVADMIMERIGDSDIAFPNNVVTPGLMEELKKRGAKFSGWQGNKPENVDEIIAGMTTTDEKNIAEANALQKRPVSEQVAEQVVDRMEPEILFRLSKNNRATVESWLKKREDLTDEQRASVIDYIDDLDDAKLQLATARWFANKTIRIPEDMDKVKQAVSVAGKAKVDPLQYDNPMSLLEAHANFKPTAERINPDNVPTLHKADEYPADGVVVYDVDEGEESRKNMRQIINTHFGEDASPWCLLQGDGKGNLTKDSKKYWNHYDAYPKQVAFKDGKLLAFSANDSGTKVWWDRQDTSHYGIPITKKIDGDELGRSAVHVLQYEAIMKKDALERDLAHKYNCPPYRLRELASPEDVARLDEVNREIAAQKEAGSMTFQKEGGSHLFRGNRQNGVYEEWSADGETLLERVHYKDGKENGVSEEWYPSGQLMKRAEMKDDNYAGNVEYWFENGNQRIQAHFNKNHKRDGESIVWWKNGELSRKTTYKDGEIVGEDYFYGEDGRPSSIYRYDDNGDLVGFDEYLKSGLVERTTYTENGVVKELLSARAERPVMFRISNANQEIFVSNAANALDKIKMEKATPEQWKKMLEKEGGLKAGEDKWLGLSEWLDGLERKTVTKQEVSDFIEQNKIKIEETRYAESVDNDYTEAIKSYNKELREIAAQGESEDEDENYEWAFDQMVERYGDDFKLAFELNGKHLSEITDFNGDLDPAAEYFIRQRIGDSDIRRIHGTRLAYTSKGLTNKQEIALTVPTIEPWNEDDQIHFGDAGEGRAISWARFGDASVSKAKDDAEKAYREAEKEFKDYRDKIIKKYSKPIDEDAERTYAEFMRRFNDGHAPSREEQEELRRLEGARNASLQNRPNIKDLATKEENAKVKELQIEASRLYHEWQYGSHKREKVLVIDEIQSKRHQEAREQGGYKNDILLKKAEANRDAAKKAYDDYYNALLDKYGDFNELYDKITPEENAESQRLYRELSDAEKAVARNGFEPMEDETYRKLREEQYAFEHSGEFKQLMDDWMKAEGYEARQAINEKLKPFQQRNRELIQQMEDREKELADEFNATHKSKIPAAPFEKNWAELTMKRMLRYAAENGYEYMAWTTGEQQADRYSLSQLITGISVASYANSNRHPDWRTVLLHRPGEGGMRLYVDAEGNIQSGSDEFVGENISNVVGKEIAVKILTAETNVDGVEISGEDLKVGGEGMKGFYDEILPRFMNKYGKQWGVKVEDITLPWLENEDGKTGVTMHSVKITPEMKESVMEGQLMFRMAEDRREGEDSLDFVKRVVKALPYKPIVPVVSVKGKEDGPHGNYDREKKIITIFAKKDTASAAHVEDTYFHENFHAAVDRMEDKTPFIADFLRVARPRFSEEDYANLENLVREKYAEDEFEEEVGANLFAALLQDGNANFDSMSAEQKPQMDVILNDLGYEPEREARERSDADNQTPLAPYRLRDTEAEDGREQGGADDLEGGRPDSTVTAEELADRYDNQDGSSKYPWMSEGELIYAVENNIERDDQTDHLFELVDRYHDLEEENFAEGKRDFAGGEMDDLFEEILDELRSLEPESPAFRITPEMDAEYMEAVNAGDMEKAQEMVRDAAALAMPDTKVVDEDGKPKVVYHGTLNKGFTVFDKPGDNMVGLIWTTDDKRYAEYYHDAVEEIGGVYRLFSNITNPLELGYIEDVIGSEPWGQIAEKLGMTPEELFKAVSPETKYEDAVRQMHYIYDYTRTSEFVNLLKDHGYDGVIAQEDGVNKIPTYGAVDPSQVKSAEPVERDDDGKVVPLSKRFNPDSSDIRFKLGVDEQMSAADAVARVQANGLAGILDKELVGNYFMTAYSMMPEDDRKEIARQAIAEGMNFRRPVRDYIAELAKKGYEEDETGFLRNLATLISASVPNHEPFTWDQLLYMMWRDARRYTKQDILSLAEDISLRKKLGVAEFANRFPGEAEAVEQEAEKNVEVADAQRSEERKEAISEVKKGSIAPYEAINRAMTAQRQYDRATVDGIVNLAKQMIREGNISGVTAREMGRLMTIIKSTNGRRPETVKNCCKQLMDFMVAHTLQSEKDQLDKLLKVKTAKVKEPGVDVMTKLDVRAQLIIKTFKENMSLDTDSIENKMADIRDKMTDSRTSETRKEELQAELDGLALARQYASEIAASEDTNTALREAINSARADFKELTPEQQKQMEKAYREYYDACYDEIRRNNIERVNAYRELNAAISREISEGKDRAKSFLEAERERIEKINHFANSDLQGVPATKATQKEKKGFVKSISGLAHLLASPLANAEQLFRVLGRRSMDGRGYLYQYFVPKIMQASDNQKLGEDAAFDKINKKLQEIYGDPSMSLRDLYLKTRRAPKATISYMDGSGKIVTEELGQGQLLYIYMVDKMPDGRMKLREMGITEDQVRDIRDSLDPKLIEFADWVQEDFLAGLRDKYNEVHKRMFGTSMAAIDNYFPLKIAGGAIHQEVDVNGNDPASLASTLTGAIIKRTVNKKQLDLVNADAFNVLSDHIEEMEEWAAFAEVRKDINTLLSYDRFRNQVKHLKTVFGTNEELWRRMVNTMTLAVKKYNGRGKEADDAVLNAAKAVSAAKVNFRVYTALKQFLSFPAYITDTSPEYLAKSVLTPWESWKWAMKNLPSAKKRWESGTIGNEKLEKTDADWSMWESKFGQFILKDGMLPNRAVDMLTVSVGAKAIYDTKKRRYMKEGFSEEQADKKAKMDAELLFNATQQSSESLFLSTLQKDSTVISNILTVFRNASMGYQRQLHQAIRSYGRMLKPGYKKESIEFMTKQLIREGLPEDQAEKVAKNRYNRQALNNAVRIATFGFLLQFAWNIGSNMVYLLFGDDDDKKKEMLMEDLLRANMGGMLEGFAGGNAISEALYLIASGENLYGRDFLQLPIASDIKNLYSHLKTDPVRSANDLVNLAFQIGLGSNPQVVSDAIVAIVDACNGDMETAKEAMFCILRIIQVPQSQLDELMIDEIGMTAGDAQKLSYEQIAKRYTDYRMNRDAAMTKWAYSDELREKREKEHQKTFKKKYNARKKLKEQE